MGIAALVLGIISFLVACVPFCGSIAILPAMIGIVLGIVDLVSKVRKGSRIPAIFGMVLSGLSFLIIAFWIVFLLVIGIENKYVRPFNPNFMSTEVEDIINEDKMERNITFEVDQEACVNDMSIKVDKVEKSNGNDAVKPQPGNEFVIVTVTVTNKGYDTNMYLPSDFTMQNSQGQIKEGEKMVIDGVTNMTSGYLIPDGKVTGSLIFEQPANDKQLTLIYSHTFDLQPELKIKIVNEK